MVTRLGIFLASLLLLPLLGNGLHGYDWGNESGHPVSAQGLLAAAAFLAVYCLLLNRLTVARGGANWFGMPRRILLWLTGAGVVTGGLLIQLHRLSAVAAPEWDVASLAAALLLCLTLLPAVQVTRAALSTQHWLLKLASRFMPAVPAPKPEPTSLALLALTGAGLMGGVVRPELALLLWCAPLFLLLALQLLWHEHTLFSGLPRGDWQRPLLAALAGLIVGELVLTVYLVTAADPFLPGSQEAWFAALCGLLTAQLNELVASGWRGKPRGELFKRKTFPIPVVVKKD
jgi:hypothetical protein